MAASIGFYFYYITKMGGGGKTRLIALSALLCAAGNLFYTATAVVKPDILMSNEGVVMPNQGYMFREFYPRTGADAKYSLAHAKRPAPSSSAIQITSYTQRRDNIELSYAVQGGAPLPQGAFIELPIYYYPGYKALFNKSASLPLQAGTNSFIRAALPEGEAGGTISVRYRPLPRFIASYVISLLTLAALIGNRGRERVGSARSAVDSG
jgi:hypothetical protein